MKVRALDLILFVAMIAAVVGGLLFARQRAIAIYGGKSAQTEWDAWREDAKELSKGPGPVIRRTPKSAEPPALKLMRDYFAVCLALALLLSSVLFIATLAFLRGALAAKPFVDRSLPEAKQPDTQP